MLDHVAKRRPRVNFTCGVFQQRREKGGLPLPSPFLSRGKSRKKARANIFSGEKRFYDIYTNKVNIRDQKLVSEFLPLVFVFSKIEQEGEEVVGSPRRNTDVINFIGKLIRSWTRYKWRASNAG